VDTLEHITEYGSAADHSLTLQKWQELNMPLSTPGVKESSLSYLSNKRSAGRGVFEEDLGSSAEGRSKSPTEEARWKFGGPWLAGLTVGEFNEYIRTTIRGRKAEFLQFLRENKALEDTKTAQRKAAEAGEDPPPAINSSDITEEQLQLYIRELRQDRGALFRHIRLFLDLPPAPSPRGYLEAMELDIMDSMGTDSGSKIPTLNSEDFLPKSNSPYADTGPPRTHPSAGLSYLRTNNYIFNHPVYGPQERPPPVQGRVVMPKNSVGANQPKLGVAGVVVNAPQGEGFNTSNMPKARYGQVRKETHPGLINIEPDKVGGSKVWLHPKSASIDPKGRISLDVVSGDGPARVILEGKVDEVLPDNRYTMRPTKPFPRPPNTTVFGSRSEQTPRGDSGDGHDAMKTLQSLLASAGDRD
jgi:hypothetical protein